MSSVETGQLPPAVEVRFRRLHPGEEDEIALPVYHSALAAGMDIRADLRQPLAIEPGRIVMVPTGFAVAIPPGFEIQVRPRSGLAIKHGVTVVNAPGTIDADYRGEIMIGLINLGSETFTIKRHDRIAQLVLARVERALPVESVDLDETGRQAGGFGHTGV
jgi:dUTP pyrophosphatase